ncbi:MAG: GNAT family N-acetyltransferase [Cloacibacillus evryensis]
MKKAVIKHKTNIYGYGEADAVIETERLIMREITEADFEAASRILGDAGVMYAWEHGFSEEEVRRWIGECIRRYGTTASTISPRSKNERRSKHRPSSNYRGMPPFRRAHIDERTLGHGLRDGGREGLAGLRL